MTKHKGYQMTKHHLKPRCRGGDSSPRNVVLVPRDKHEAFHRIFHAPRPEQLAKKLTLLFNNKKGISRAYLNDFRFLFGSMNSEEIVEEVNNQWIDPDYFVQVFYYNGFCQFKSFKKDENRQTYSSV